MRTCRVCGDEKPLEEFAKSKNEPGGRSHRCKPCISSHSAKWYRENRESILRRERERYAASGGAKHLRRYGITREAFDALVDRQGGLCALCGTRPEKGLCVDHDHETGAVRGLLCNACNAGLGKLGDNLDGLKRAVAYLESARG